MTFLYAIVLLGVLIFVHEVGHFMFAKFVRVKVLKFSLGFGPKIIGRKVGETEYQISAVPLGGYVKMLGEDHGDEVAEDDRARAYNAQSVWKRLVIVASGPVFNILFAMMLFIFMFLSGVPILLPEIGEIVSDSPAAKAGLVKGDGIIEINGMAIKYWDDITDIIHKSAGVRLQLKVRRGNEVIDISVTPEKKAVPDIFGEKKEVGIIGVKPSGSVIIEKQSIWGAIIQGVGKTWELSVLTLVSIVKLIQRIIPAETIGGPIMIFQMAGQQAAHGLLNFFTFMAVISINLGILNLLPIPILDGGHMLFLGIEAIRGRPLSDKVVVTAQKAGLAIIIALMFFAFYNDITRIVSGKALP